MNFSGIGSGAAVSAYLSSLLARTSGASGAEGSGAAPTAGLPGDSPAARPLMKATSDAALEKAAKGVKASAGQRQLEAKAAALGHALQSAMQAAGVTPGSAVSFSVAPGGKLAIQAPEQAADRVTAFLEQDASVPSFRERIAALTQEADAHAQTLRQHAAISQAARYAANASSVLSLYGALMQRQEATPAVFTLAAGSGSLSYPGMLQSVA